MNASSKDKPGLRRNEIAIAIIGLTGVLATAVFSNWDKMFPPESVIEARYSGYRPTGNFETELRYFYEVSGTRATVDYMMDELMGAMKTQFISQYPADAKEIDAVMKVVAEETASIDSIISESVPIYRKHFTIEQIQELNKFYSTEIMQDMINKMPLVVKDFAPIQMKLMQDTQNRVISRMREIRAD